MGTIGKSITGKIKDDTPLVTDRFYLPDLCTVQSLLFIILAGVLLAIVFTLASSGLKYFSWQQCALISLFILWIVLVSVAALCRLRVYLVRFSLLQGVILSYAVVLYVTLMVSLIGQWLAMRYLNQYQGFDYWLVAQQVLIAAILAGVSLRYLYLQEQLHIQQRAELASRIQALQSRIRPHFLFNSMNIIASLIETEPALAEQVVEDLSELFRATLSDANQLVPVQQEVDLAKNYVRIECLRMGDRLAVDWQVGKIDPTAVVPQLSLQPLIENAIYHGIQPLPQGGTIEVHINQTGKKIQVTVRNPVAKGTTAIPQSRDANHKGNQLALDNLEHRLKAYYGNEAQLNHSKREDVFEVEFICPMQPVERVEV